MKNKFIIILVACASRKEAGNIAGLLLKKHLIACASIIPNVESKFWWEGRINSAKEVMMVIKTKEANFGRVEKEVRHAHSYDVPEIVALPIIAGSRDYLKWIAKSVKTAACLDS